MKTLLPRVFSTLVFIVLSYSTAFGQTGKIAGTVTDAQTGEPLPGVNVVIEGTTQGTATDVDGYYAILNVSPGTHTLVASFIGFQRQVIEGVRVSIDLTSEVDIQMREEAIGLDEVVVQAQQEMIRPDISASMSNISSDDVENVPVASVEEVIDLQAGISGLSVRGGNLSSLNYQVDGVSTFDGRSHSPFTGVSYTAVQEIQVQTGGFNAEHGNVRSGLINVVTKDAPRNRYTFDFLGRFSPASKGYFGDTTPASPEFYYQRPFLDDEVAFEGTGAWDTYERRQFPDWNGWNEWAKSSQNDGDPSNDILVQGAEWDELSAEEQRQSAELWQDVFKWYHRKDFEVNDPEYVIDGSVGGPVPGISKALGNLRFFGSFRQKQNAYIIPQRRSTRQDRLGRLKLTSDIAPGLKLQVQGMLSRDSGLNGGRSGDPFMLSGERGSRNQVHQYLKHVLGYKHFIYGTDSWSLMDVDRYQLGADLTHTLSARTFYKVQVSRFHADYHSYRSRERRVGEVVNTVGNIGLDEAPFGWGPNTLTTVSPTGMDLGGVYQRGRDTSWVNTWDAQFDITSQINRYLQLKSGVDFISSENLRNQATITWNTFSQIEDWNRSYTNGAAYSQAKLEFKGLVANLGLRADYYKGVGDWMVWTPFDSSIAMAQSREELEALLTTEDIEPQLALSPRLGISFPVTSNSKFFFNYGHFRERLEPARIFDVGRGSGNRFVVTGLGNPEHPMPKTTAYELGYEHNLFDQFHVRLTGYYKDLSDQPRTVRFESADGKVSYSTPLPYNYEDIRGFEVSLSRNTGYVRGFVNYTFMARKGGNFGYGVYQENPVDRAEYRLEARNRQSTPIPTPFANLNLQLIAPSDFGPEVAGVSPFGDWRLSFLGEWRAGSHETWCGGGGGCEAGLQNNVQWKDFWMLDLRLSKNFQSNMGQIQVFADVYNALNIRHLNTRSGPGAGRGAFMGLGEDFRHYMESLHLPEEAFEDLDEDPYLFVPGSDRPGVYRDVDSDFVPIEPVLALPDEGMQRTNGRGPLYWEKESGNYFVWNGNSFEAADQSLVDEVLDDKLYIDMPNLNAFTFLDPREVLFGVRLTF